MDKRCEKILNILEIEGKIKIWREFQWPEPQELKLKLADLLEQEVDERYYISQEKTDKLLMQLKDKEISNTIRTEGRGSTDKHQWDMVAMPCITPDRIEKRQNGRRFKEDGEPMFTLTGQDRHGILQVGKLEDINGHDICKRVYSPEGCSPTLPTGTSENTTPKILEDFYSNREVRVSDDCPTIRAEREGLKVLTYNTKDENGKEPPQQDRVYNIDGVMTTLSAQLNGRFNVLIPEATKKGYAVAEMGDSINMQQLGSKTRRGRAGKEVAQTLDTRCEQGILNYDYRIRRLIPLECFRLMGFSDEDFYRAKNALNATFYKGKDKSDSQLYKEAGNSIVVNVLMAIFKQMQKAGIIGGEQDA
jgi:DNA (cytosine-5)-methyltransferase 1